MSAVGVAMAPESESPPSAITTPVLEARGIVREYGAVIAVAGIDLPRERGDCRTVFGPNGAGKSTLMRTIATLQEADEGEIQMDEINVLEQKDDVRKLLGYLPQEFGIYPKVSAEDMLNHIAVLKGITKAKERK